MKPFTKEPECEKCGGLNIAKTFATYASREWIACRCVTCDHYWSMKCKDAPTEVKDEQTRTD